MKLPVQKPMAGDVALYEGFYCPHWEIDHVLVRVPRWRKLSQGAVVLCAVVLLHWIGWLTRTDVLIIGAPIAFLTFLPAYEKWQSIFPPGGPDGLDDKGGRIEFEGVVTSRGRFGHLGYLQRRVEVTRVIRYDPGQLRC